MASKDSGTAVANALEPLVAATVLAYLLYRVLKIVLNKAEGMNKTLQEELGIIEERRRKLFLKREQLGEEEFFFEKYGYSYDWVFVFPIGEEPDTEAFQVMDEATVKINKEEWRKNLHRDADFKKFYSMKTVVDTLQTAGLETKLFYSTQRDECYCKIRCPPTRMEWMANFLEYKLKLDMDRCQYAMKKGRKGVWKGRVIKDDLNLCPDYGPYEHIYGKFDMSDDEKLILYKRYKLTSTIDSPFRNIDRIKLINEIFRQPATGDVPGCGFELSRLQAKGCLLGYFPLHDMSAKISLERRWLAINTLPNRQPIEQIKDYFGEKIALYYGWIGVYTTFLGYASGAAIITYIWSAAEGRTDSEITPYFASFIALWCTVFLESWKRQEAAYRVEWGMTGFEDMETSRPSYWGFQRTLEGAQVTSNVDGKPTVYFPAMESAKRKVFSNVVTAVFIVIVCIVVFAIFGLKTTMQSEPYRSRFTLLPPFNIEFGGLIPSVLQSVSITVFSSVWKVVSLKLTILENHRTDTFFEDSLIVKTFSFEFVNKYAACFYAAFAKKYFVSGESCDPSCFDEVATILGTLFILELAIGNTGEVYGAFSAKKKREIAESVGVSPDRKASLVEKQYTAESYDKMLGTFRNYQEMAFQFGYATLFSAAYPLAPVLAYLNNFVEIRVDGWKLLQIHRRPEPAGAEDIGAWYGILDLISMISVVTNGLLIFFVAKKYENVSWINRFVLFIVFEHVILAAKIVLAAVVPDESPSTRIQGERQEFIPSKVIDHVPDDEPELGKERQFEAAGFDIADGDEDPMF